MRGELNRIPTRTMKHIYSIYRQQREFHEVILFSVKNKKLPQGVEYRVSGIYICSDFAICNKEMKDAGQIHNFVRRILFG